MSLSVPFHSFRAIAVLAASLAWILPAGVSRAQDIQVNASISPRSVDLGDTFIYSVAIDGASAAEERALSASDDYKSEYLGGRDESSHSIFTINGHTTENKTLRFVMQWRITPLKAGRGEIESFTVKAGSKTLTVPAVAFQANEPGANPNFQLTLEPEKTEAYVGEPVHMKMTWVLGRNVKSAAFSGPDGGKDFDVLAIDPRPVRTRSNPVQSSDPYRVVPFLDGQFVITRSQMARDGQTLPAFTADIVVTARKAGKLDVGPYRVAFDEVVGQKQRTFFDSPFDDLSQTRRSVVPSNTVTLDVKPLPEEGRPADFNGLIGNYSLDATAGNSEASVGDPISLTLTIRGPEPLDHLKPPSLDSQPELEAGFKPAPEGWEASDASNSGERTFTTTIRPKADSITQVPPIRLPFFDTKTGKYDVAQSKPIPLKVHAAKEVTLADALHPSTSPGLQLPIATAPAKLTDAPVGIGANTESLAALADQRVSMIAMLRTPGGIAFMVAPPAALAFLGVLAHRRKVRDPKLAARREALSAAKRATSRASSVPELLSAIRTGVAPMLDVDADAVTSRDALEGPTAPLHKASDLLAMLEGAAFDGRPVDLAGAKSLAMDVLSELSRS